MQEIGAKIQEKSSLQKNFNLEKPKCSYIPVEKQITIELSPSSSAPITHFARHLPKFISERQREREYLGAERWEVRTEATAETQSRRSRSEERESSKMVLEREEKGESAIVELLSLLPQLVFSTERQRGGRRREKQRNGKSRHRKETLAIARLHVTTHFIDSLPYFSFLLKFSFFFPIN